MATKPLPTIATDSQGRPVKQDSGEALLKNSTIMVVMQKTQLDVLTDILGVVKNIADNIVAGMRAQGLVYASMQSYLDTAREGTKNKLAEIEKQRENITPEDTKNAVEKSLFEKFFGGFKKLMNLISAVLVPFLVGFFLGIRKEFAILGAVIIAAIRWPITTFKLISKTFGFLYEMTVKLWDGVKILGTKIKNLIMSGPKLVKGLFTDLSLVFLRIKDAITNNRAFKIISSIFGKAKNIFNSIIDFIQPLLKFFTEGRGIFTKLLNLGKFLGRFNVYILAALAIFDGIMGAIEGFKEGGVLGAFRGAMVGIIDGLVGWLVGIGQFIVSGLLDLFGFEDAAKIVEEFNFKEFLKEYIGFLNPILMLIDLFDESSPIRRLFKNSLDKISNVGDFVSDVWKEITSAIREVLIKLGKAVPGGERLLNWLGINEQDQEDIQQQSEERKIASTAEYFRNFGMEDVAEDIEDADTLAEAKTILMEKYGYPENKANEILGIPQPRAAPTPVPPANRAQELDKRREEADRAKQGTPPTTTTNTTVVNAPNNIRSTTNMNQAPQAGIEGLGAKGKAGFSTMNTKFA